MTRARTINPRRFAARALLALAASSTATLHVPIAAAQPKPSAAELADAKSHFEKGLKLYKERSLPEALAEFTQANRVVPRASVLRNIAQCHRDMKQFAAAYADYAEMLAKYASSLKPVELKQIEAAIADLAVVTGLVRVQAAESGAAIEIDGRDVGVTPLAAPARVNVGTHEIVVKKPGFATFAKRVELVGKDEVTVAVDLARDTARLVVTAPGAGAGAHLRLDGADVGALPWEGDVAAGAHRLDVTGQDLHSATRTVELARGGRAEVVLELTRDVGHVLIDPHAADAEIRVDGARVGKGAWEGELKVGRHEVAIDAAGFTPFRRVVLVHAGERRVESIVLEAAGGKNDYRGVYVGVDAALALSPNPDNYAKALCGSAISCTSGTLALGPTGMLSVGYSFGWLGLEGVGAFRFDESNVAGTSGAGATTPASKRLDTTFDQFAFGGGVGARVFSKHPVVRFSGGFRVLVVHELFSESITQDTLLTKRSPPSASATGPLFAWDAGLLLGSTPGAKFHVGVLATLEVLGSVTEAAKAQPPVQSFFVAKGAELFIGPALGVQFGY